MGELDLRKGPCFLMPSLAVAATAALGVWGTVPFVTSAAALCISKGDFISGCRLLSRRSRPKNASWKTIRRTSQSYDPVWYDGQ